MSDMLKRDRKAAQRYEKVRCLNPRQFKELWDRNIRGEGAFDDLVDRLDPQYLSDDPRDYVEDWPGENGRYCNTCLTCDHTFIGHKRRCHCRVCDPPEVNGE